MRLDRVRGEIEPFGDAAVGEALGHEREDLALAGGELVERARLSHTIEEL